MSEGNNTVPVKGTHQSPSVATKPLVGRESKIERGSYIHHVRNLELAACLVSVGIKLRKDPPYTHVKLTDGTDQWTFHFEERDTEGHLKTAEMIKAFSQDMEWIEKHPVHPMTFAMCAIKNLASFKEHMLRSVGFVGFKAPNGEATLYVKDGSRKHKNCIAKGMIQVNPGWDK
jgi:hypothetical protein